MSAPPRPPGVRHVAVVGAGMVGLSTAWFLQEHGVEVTVLESDDVAAGSSWGNAGWLTPALTAPLPEPAVLTYGVRALLSSSSPVYVPLRPQRGLLRFLAGFARNSTQSRWTAGMRAYAPLNADALTAFDRLVEGGVDAQPVEAEPFLACYRTAAERNSLLEELDRIAGVGQELKFEPVTGAEARDAQPALSAEVGAAVRIWGQRYIGPPDFMRALADSVRARGGRIVTGARVTRVRDDGAGVRVMEAGGGERRFDAVVAANGAWLGQLVRELGVRQVVQAGRGYSFSVAARQVPTGPVYFPSQRVACTPIRTSSGLRLRVAGMMEFRPPGAPADPRRIAALVSAVRPLLDGLALEDRQDEWVGSRPCTPDGLPLIGRTRSPRVFVAGGHGMWGIALGPLTGELLARQVVTGESDPRLAPFDPTR